MSVQHSIRAILRVLFYKSYFASARRVKVHRLSTMSSSAADISFGAMTPDPKAISVTEQEDVIGGTIERKSSKSSITRADDQSIPSPPLSPYQSAASSSDAMTTPRQIPEVLITGLNAKGKQSDDHVDTILVLPGQKVAEFPIDNFEKFPLVVNAWSGIGSKSYKKSQMHFLKQYTCRMGLSRGITKATPQRKYQPRKVHKPSNYYNSDSDYSSTFEKVRTRRLVKETSNTDVDSETSKVSTPPPKRRRPAATSPTVPVNVDWESLPDFSPSVDTLPNNNRCMKVEWKGQPMDLKSDPLVSHLHPAEIVLASTLRLPCALYLDSKRRLFAEKVSRMRKGLPFRRTDAQKSCRIDVNKASRLFAAFEKCGWLDDGLFEKYL